MLKFALFLGFASASQLMHGAPILYNLNLTGGSPNATGSFQYDASLSVNPFSNVAVNWNGAAFNNMTGQFNAFTGVTVCAGQTGETAIFNILTAGACGGATWTASFDAAALGLPGLVQAQFIFSLGGRGVIQSIAFATQAPSTSTSGAVTASAAVPEPSSFTLLAAGGALLAWMRRRQNNL